MKGDMATNPTQLPDKYIEHEHPLMNTKSTF